MKLDVLLSRIAKRFRPLSPDEAMARLQEKYRALRTLTSANNDALEILADLQRTASGEFLFDASYLREAATRALTCGRAVLEAFDVLTDGRQHALAAALGRIDAEVATVLAARVDVPPGPFVLPLDEATTVAAELTGAKIRRLAEIRAAGGIPVPDGFVVTSAACQRLLAQAHLWPAIHDAIERLTLIDREALARTSTRITSTILEAEWPDELRAEILRAHGALMTRAGTPDGCVSVRSSAVGEDEDSTFAGQHLSLLNVSGERLLEACKQVLASQFGPRAVIYYKARGLEAALVPMAICVMVMVDARASGVLYTQSPDGDEASMVASGTWGLGPSTAEGRVSPDVFRVARNGSGEVVGSRIAAKATMLLAGRNGGIVEAAVPGWMRAQPCLTREQIRELAAHALRLERHYASPQDVEWALDAHDAIVVLQSRPLRVRANRDPVAVVAARKDLPVLVNGTPVSRGIAAGPVVKVGDLPHDDVGPGSVIVARTAAPELATLIDRAVAIVTEAGSVASHLATVAREFGVPAVFDAGGALTVLPDRAVVTVDAEMGNVYAGRIETLLACAAAPKHHALAQVPVFRRLEALNRVLTPLNLTDPRSRHFRPTGCRTLHDVLRYAHEIAVQEMFLAGNDAAGVRASARLASELPLDIRVIDLGGGLDAPVDGGVITPDRVRSRPFLALWTGLSDVNWNLAPAAAGAALGSVVLTALTSRPAEGAAAADYALLTDAYMNVNLRFGYHFSRVDALLDPGPRANYASVVFHGGAAGATGRTRRIDFIAAILQARSWRVARRDDALFARIETLPESGMSEEIRIVGRLLAVTRQIDTRLADEATTARAIAAFRSGDYTLGLEDPCHEER